MIFSDLFSCREGRLDHVKNIILVTFYDQGRILTESSTVGFADYFMANEPTN